MTPRSKELALYAGILAVTAAIFCLYKARDTSSRQLALTVVENPHVTWINDRKPTQADCGNRAGLVWVFSGGKAKIRFYHNVQDGTYWATIKEPVGPREKWIENIIDAVEGSHCSESF